MNRYWSLSLLIFIIACKGAGNKVEKASSNDTSDSSSTIIGNQDGMSADSSNQVVALNRLVVPGKSIGLTIIGQFAQDAIKHLGRPDAGDAAMGKSVSTWFSKDSAYKTQVYASMQNGKEGDKPAIKSIRVSSPFFETSHGLKVGSKLNEIRKVYPGLLMSGTYQKKNSPIKVYDDSKTGIAFEINKAEICVGICVHTPGERAFMQYLPFEESFKTKENEEP